MYWWRWGRMKTWSDSKPKAEPAEPAGAERVPPGGGGRSRSGRWPPGAGEGGHGKHTTLEPAVAKVAKGDAGEVVRSQENPWIKRVRRAGRGQEPGSLVLDGPHLVGEALEAGIALPVVLITPEFARREEGAALVERIQEAGRAAGWLEAIRVVDAGLLTKLAETETPAGVLALARWKLGPAEYPRFWAALDRAAAGGPPFVVVADGIQDPGNLGSLFRTAAAAGAQGMIILPGTVAPTNSKVLRASAGALFRLPWIKMEAGELAREVRARGIRVFLADARGEQAWHEPDYRGGTAIVISNEGRGPSPEARALADGVVAIPLAGGVESLNAAAAGAILLFEVVRQRGRALPK